MAIAGRVINLTAADGGEFSAFVARPGTESGPAIVLLHEIFGITDWVKETAELFAARGYCVAAPELFSRLDRNFVADPGDPEQTQKGLVYRGLLDHALAVADINCTINMLRMLPECNGKTGIVGFCLGGTLAYLSAARLEIDAGAAYYGTQIHEFIIESKHIHCPLLLHMGTRDALVPGPLLEKIDGALADNEHISIYHYDAGHAFANSHRAEHYHRDASSAAHARTFELFDRLR